MPDGERMFLRLIEASIRNGTPTSAMLGLGRMNSSYPCLAPSLRRSLASTALSLHDGNASKALRGLEQLLRTHSGELDATGRLSVLSYVALAKALAGDTSGVMSTLARMERLEPKDVPARWRSRACLVAGSLYLREGLVDKAEHKLTTGFDMAACGDDAELRIRCLCELAVLERYRGNFGQSFAYAEKAMALSAAGDNDRLATAAVVERARLHLETGEYEKCLELLCEFPGRDSEMVRTTVGECLLAMGRTDAAVSQLSPPAGRDRGVLRLACALMARGLEEEAAGVLCRLGKKPDLDFVDRSVLKSFQAKLVKRLRLLRDRTGPPLYEREWRLLEPLAAMCRGLATGASPELHHPFGGAVKNLSARLRIDDDSGFLIVDRRGRRFSGTAYPEQSFRQEDHDFFFDGVEGKVYRKGHMGRLELRTRGGSLLALLMLKGGQPLSKGEIYESIWERRYNALFNDNNIYVALADARKRCGDRKPFGIIKVDRNGRYYFPAHELSWGMLLPASFVLQNDPTHKNAD